MSTILCQFGVASTIRYPGAASVEGIPAAVGSCSGFGSGFGPGFGPGFGSGFRSGFGFGHGFGSWRGRGLRVGVRWSCVGATACRRYCASGADEWRGLVSARVARVIERVSGAGW